MNLSLGIAPYFRRFELPWGLGEESEQKFVKLLRILLIVATVLAIVIYLLPQPERTKIKPEDLSERVVQLIVRKPKPPPPPPPPIPEEKPKPEEAEARRAEADRKAEAEAPQGNARVRRPVRRPA